MDDTITKTIKVRSSIINKEDLAKIEIPPLPENINLSEEDKQRIIDLAKKKAGEVDLTVNLFINDNTVSLIVLDELARNGADGFKSVQGKLNSITPERIEFNQNYILVRWQNEIVTYEIDNEIPADANNILFTFHWAGVTFNGFSCNGELKDKIWGIDSSFFISFIKSLNNNNEPKVLA